MVSTKISCAHCSHHARCSQKTRIFVNYCGADYKKMSDHIRMAVMECRSRRGRLFIQEIIMLPREKGAFHGAMPAIA